MPYDATLDKQLFTRPFQVDDNMQIVVSIYSYNNGPQKVQISRESTDSEGNPRFAKLGRLTKEELAGVLPLLTEALNKL